MIRLFNNRYKIEQRLGNGGMAIVYSGTDTLLRRRVAVKVLREQFAADDDFVRRFSYEAQAAAKLSHPNLVNVYDFGTEDGDYYIVMELIDGETLDKAISTERVIPESVAVDYAIQIASGLAYAHRQGLLHRDIKPANILITKDDVVKISDFGIARAVSEQSMGVTQPGMVMGSVYYLSPEQAQGHATDETSDLYSVGVVLYQMLTGMLPFTGDSPVAVALKHVSAAAPLIDPATAGVSPAVASIVERLLQKNPRARFQSATDLASALREARERPTLTQTIGAGTRGDDPTMTIPITPPPRRSSAPDRPGESQRNGRGTVAAERISPPNSNGLRLAVFAVLLAAAVLIGYTLIQHPLFGPPRNIAVGDYRRQSSAQAQEALIALGLRPKVTTLTSEDVAPDRVIRQDPAAATMLAAGSDVVLFVSSGAPLNEVPDVKGYTRADAERVLAGAKFKTKAVGRFGNEPKDTVVDVNPSAGTKSRAGSMVVLTVSKGRQPAIVPNVVSLTKDAAQAALAAAGLKLEVVQQTESDTIPENTVASQDPEDGKAADRGSTVQVVISTGAASVNVPDVGGKMPDEASSILSMAGLKPDVKYNVDPTNAGGNVTAQQPAPNTQAKKGTKITLFVSVPGTVPDLSNLSLDDAKAALAKSGYQVGNIATTTDGQEGKVVRTEPEANSALRAGESVVIYYHPPAGQ